MREDGTALLLRVRLTPNASIDRIEGIETAADGSAHLKCRVRAIPEKGAANAAVEKLVAKTLRIPKSAVTVIGGMTARVKTLRIEPGPETRTLLASLLGKGEA
ncbi:MULTISPECIES: DUF167 family protein [Hyphobacterium]|uniref:UPF0235 protein ACFOOR_08540 n=1 Tax=Hyphobacterium vulgare TaxID=1736751 RepID=A0ABV6ZXN1_9PROT